MRISNSCDDNMALSEEIGFDKASSNSWVYTRFDVV